VTSARLGDGERLEERLALAIDGLRALDADVIGLQEASVASDRGDVAARVADALGYHHVRASSGWRWMGWMARTFLGFEEGPAIVSRFPIMSAQVMPLDACDRGYGRVLLCATLATPWGEMDACSTHTASSACQLRSIAALLVARHRTVPLVLTGDLNTTGGSEGSRYLRTTLGVRDTFHAANPHVDGVTVWQPVRDPARRATRRVDFVLAAPAPDATLRVLDSRVVLDQPGAARDGTPLWPSDHYGVLSDVVLF
jgi:endonuclease/exonuclease/phosphatase family metal-dependent hydrolase